MSVNKVILIGFVGKDPEVRHLEGGTSVAKFTLATSESYKNKSGEIITSTEWHNIIAWRQLAELIEKWVFKGKQLYIEGKITNRSFDDKDGNKKYITEIVADTIQFIGKKDEDQKPRSAETSELPEPDNVRQPETDDLPF
jgi:single-strand DNA-binding protein